jgi:type II secretory pathway pseudopilin PulG
MKDKINKIRFVNQKGQSLFELLLAIGISALIIVVLVSLVSNALQNAAFSKNETLAARYAEAATEWLRGQRDNNIDVFITNATTAPNSWCLRDESLTNSSWNRHTPCSTSDKIPETPFYRQVDFTVSTVSGKRIYLPTVSVSWTDAKGIHKVTSATKLSDWRER